MKKIFLLLILIAFLGASIGFIISEPTLEYRKDFTTTIFNRYITLRTSTETQDMKPILLDGKEIPMGFTYSMRHGIYYSTVLIASLLCFGFGVGGLIIISKRGGELK